MQPPSGGCVLKPNRLGRLANLLKQPPSGGCVLKPNVSRMAIIDQWAATFGWLCVETLCFGRIVAFVLAATFGWLCVETLIVLDVKQECFAATFGWLCVETLDGLRFDWL